MHLKRLLFPGMLAALTAMLLIFLIVAAVGVGLLLTDKATTRTAEAGGMWFGWVHHPPTDTFVRIYEDGSSEQHTLTLSPGERLASSPRAFASNGEWLAFCTYNETAGMWSLVVHNFNPDAAAKAGQTFPVVIALGQRTECSVPVNAFNVFDPNRLAFGVVNYAPSDPNADLSRPAWELFVVDVSQGAIAAQYDALMPGADALPPNDAERWVWMPYVHRFEDDQVYFELLPWGTEAMTGQKVAAWTPGTQEVTLVENSAQFVGAQTNGATGESVWLAEDPTRPAAQPMGPVPAFNVVMYQSPTMSAPVAIFHDPAVIPLQLQWVNGGQHLAILTAPGFDPNNPDMNPGESTWVLLGRDGSTQTLDLGQYVIAVAGLRDGFVMWRSNYETWTGDLLRYQWTTDPANAAQTVLFASDDPNMSLIWAAPQFTGVEGQFPAVP